MPSLPPPALSLRITAAACLAGVALLAMGSARAETQKVDARVHRACKFDYKRLCPRYKVSSAQLRACMEAKSSEISSDCISALIENGLVEDRDDKRR